jgi:hypothetical protein
MENKQQTLVMEKLKLSTTDLVFFNSKFDQISSENPTFLVVQKTSLLKKLLSEHNTKGVTSFPLVRPEVEKIVDSFRPVSKDIVKSVSEKARNICKGCIFHDDNCLVNIIFITFKSVEMNKMVEFKDLRPNIRIAF